MIVSIYLTIDQFQLHFQLHLCLYIFGNVYDLFQSNHIGSDQISGFTKVNAVNNHNYRAAWKNNTY